MSAVIALSRTRPNWQEIQKLFPVRGECAYLNNCGVAPISTPVAEALREYTDGYVNIGRYKMVDRVDGARAKAAQLIGATPEEIALVPNTVVGINIVAHGIDWRPGDNVVLPDVEFPANYFPWASLSSRGVEVKVLKCPDGRVRTDALLSLVDERTRVIALSSVQFTNGYRSDIARIGRFCREKGILFSVDAIQELGTIPMDVVAQNIDFLQSGGHKWLLGPIGTGLLYVRRALIDRLHVTFVGHDSMVDTEDHLPWRWDWWPDARRFEPGIPNHGPICGFNAALTLLLDIGIENVRQRIFELNDYLMAGLREKDCEILNPTEPNERSGIVLFKSPRVSTPELLRRLADAKIRALPRAGGIRVGPHFYNDESELDRLLALV